MQDLFRGFIHQNWTTKIDYSTLELKNATFVTDDLGARISDLVWKVRVGDESVYVYLLMEFQSESDPWMALRVMTYTGLLYQRLIKTERTPPLTPGKLPSIYPIVIYNGRRPWNARLNIEDLIEPADPGLQALHPRAGYVLLDLLRLTEGGLPDGNTVTDMIRLESRPDEDTLLKVLGGLVTRLQGPEHAPLRRALTAWIKRAILGRVVPDMDFPYVNELKELEAMLTQEVIP
jgi:hypothetical protein